MLLKQTLSSLKKSLVVAGVVLSLSAGAAQAASATGTVYWWYTNVSYDNGPVYTIVNIGPGLLLCAYVGTSAGVNVALASIFADAQNAGSAVRVSCDNDHRIVSVEKAI